MVTQYDAIILGAGPAGLTAGIYLARARRRVLIVDQSTAGGQPIFTHKIANYPGLPEVHGYELAFTLKNQARDFGCDLESNVEVTSLELGGPVKRVELDGEDVYEAPTLIVTTGGVPRSLGIPSEDEFKARGISYCATCDGDFFTDKDIVVIGGGNTALEEAVSLTRYARSVTILHVLDHFQAFPQAVEEARANEKIRFVMEAEVTAFEGDERLEWVRYTDHGTGQEHVVQTDGAFIFIGYVPASAPFASTLDLSPRGEIITNEDMATNVAGVYAAGDVRQKRYRQLTTAVADGTIAALAAIEHLDRLAAEGARRQQTPVLTPTTSADIAPTLT